MKKKLNIQTNTVKKASMWYFLLCGLGLPCWAPLVPFAKERLELTEADLGMLLLPGLGAMIMMPLSGILASKFGSRRMMLTGGIIIALALPGLSYCSSRFGMAALLFIFGGGIGMLDVSMNTHGIAVQKQHQKPIFSMLHALFSIVSLAGAFSLSFCIKWGLSPFLSTGLFSIFILIAAAVKYKDLFSKSVEKEKNTKVHSGENKNAATGSVWLNARVLLLGYFCFSFFLIEGAMLDWSAVFLTDVKKMPVELGGLGYAAFSIAMAAMRLFGDKIILKLGSRNVVAAGGLISAAGLFMAVNGNTVSLIMSGFVLIGLGTANIVPVFLSDGGSLKNLKASLALSAITTLGYSGQLAGPALIGFVAESFSLSSAFTSLIIAIGAAIAIYFFSTLGKKKHYNTN